MDMNAPLSYVRANAYVRKEVHNMNTCHLALSSCTMHEQGCRDWRQIFSFARGCRLLKRVEWILLLAVIA